jgi:hypothetical protein
MAENCKWIVSLSNGETLEEGQIREWEGNLHPWSKLIAYCKEKELTITGTRVQVNGATHMCPSFTDRAKFKSDMKSPNFADNQPVVFRGKASIDSFGNKENMYQLHFQINEPTRITWVIDAETGDTWLRLSEKNAEV